VLEGQPSPPVYFGTMKRINRDGPPVLGVQVAVPSLSASALPDALTETSVVDVRPFAAYGEAHIAGTLNLPLIKAFTTWAGWLLPYDRDISLISPDAATTAEARRALASIGLDRVRGTFGTEVIDVARQSGKVKRSVKSDVTRAEELIKEGRRVIDLREPSEWAAGHIPGAEHHPLGMLYTELADTDRAAPIAIHCQAGTRSAIGASVLEAMGFTDVVDLAGGYSGWQQRG